MLFPSFYRNDPNLISWWFLQGYFDICTSEQRYYFMTCLFQVSSQVSDKKVGHYHITALLDEKGSDNYSYSSIVDPKSIEILLENPDSHNADINPHLKNCYLEEIEQNGPPSPIVTSKVSPKFSTEIAQIQWENFCLSQQENSIELNCDFLSGQNAKFNLHTEHKPFLYEGRFSEGDGFTRIQTYSNMTLGGTIGSQEVCGEAWFDFQQSNYDFFQVKERDNTVLGWDWIGVKLEDSSSLILYIYRDMKGGRIVSKNGYLLDENNKLAASVDFNISILSYWQSPHTHITYPSDLEIDVPELKLTFSLTPLAQDQEIPILGTYRAIWEGAAQVEGHKDKKPIKGTARVEYFGYGYIFDTKKFLSSFTEKIDNELEKFLPRKIDTNWLNKYVGPAHAPYGKHDPMGCTDAISVPVWDLLDRNGKHWRPICAFLFLTSLGVDYRPYEQLISAVSELNHTGSLIIDDIEDQSLIRRGDQCIHLRYGLDTSINAGNILYFLPYLLLENHEGFNDNQKLMAYELMVRMLTKCHIGQGLDIHWSKSFNQETLTKAIDDGLEKQILQMYSYKTGAQIEGVAEMACIIANTDEETRSAYLDLGRCFGISFQIIDDVNNFNTAKGWTKKCGEDIATSTPSYVIIKAMNMLSKKDSDRLQTIFFSEELRNSNTYLQEANELVYLSGALAESRTQAQNLVDEKWQKFSQFAHHNDGKILLKMFISSILNYSYDV